MFHVIEPAEQRKLQLPQRSMARSPAKPSQTESNLRSIDNCELTGKGRKREIIHGMIHARCHHLLPVYVRFYLIFGCALLLLLCCRSIDRNGEQSIENEPAPISHPLLPLIYTMYNDAPQSYSCRSRLSLYGGLLFMLLCTIVPQLFVFQHLPRFSILSTHPRAEARHSSALSSILSDQPLSNVADLFRQDLYRLSDARPWHRNEHTHRQQQQPDHSAVSPSCMLTVDSLQSSTVNRSSICPAHPPSHYSSWYVHALSEAGWLLSSNPRPKNERWSCSWQGKTRALIHWLYNARFSSELCKRCKLRVVLLVLNAEEIDQAPALALAWIQAEYHPLIVVLDSSEGIARTDEEEIQEIGPLWHDGQTVWRHASAAVLHLGGFITFLPSWCQAEQGDSPLASTLMLASLLAGGVGMRWLEEDVSIRTDNRPHAHISYNDVYVLIANSNALDIPLTYRPICLDAESMIVEQDKTSSSNSSTASSSAPSNSSYVHCVYPFPPSDHPHQPHQHIQHIQTNHLHIMQYNFIPLQQPISSSDSAPSAADTWLNSTRIHTEMQGADIDERQ